MELVHSGNSDNRIVRSDRSVDSVSSSLQIYKLCVILLHVLGPCSEVRSSDMFWRLAAIHLSSANSMSLRRFVSHDMLFLMSYGTHATLAEAWPIVHLSSFMGLTTGMMIFFND